MVKTKNIPFYILGNTALKEVQQLLEGRIGFSEKRIIYFIDKYFSNSLKLDELPIRKNDEVLFVNSETEPTTEGIDQFVENIANKSNVAGIVGMGGGSTLDVAKAVSNLLANGGHAEDYQGWDLLKKPGIYKIGIPTISGTGAEASRTCVMLNKKRKLKLGMNSEFTLFDGLILDPSLTKTVPREQYFYTGLDTYIHCIESLNGMHRNPIADAYSYQALKLSREIFGEGQDMMSNINREKLMVASYLGGSAIANSFVGIVHPLSAGLSTVLDIHHCLANCLVMNVIEGFYPRESEEFQKFLMNNKIDLPKNVTKSLTEKDFENLYEASIIHEKPLTNALGENFKKVLTKEKITQIFQGI